MPSHTDWNITVVTQCRASSAAGSLVGWLDRCCRWMWQCFLLIVTTANRLPAKSFHVYEYYHSCNYNMRAFIGKLVQPPPSIAHSAMVVGWCTRTIIWPIIQITLSVRGIGYFYSGTATRRSGRKLPPSSYCDIFSTD